MQLAELEGLLTAEATLTMTRVVYLHHHPFLDDPFMALDDAEALLDVLAYRADVVLFGHAHRPQRWDDQREIGVVLAADDLPGAESAWEIGIDGPLAIEVAVAEL
jgi:diadenosine tetraphosphatase ApaH/serine/threonine PP2A family protein phosphatase